VLLNEIGYGKLRWVY